MTDEEFVQAELWKVAKAARREVAEEIALTIEAYIPEGSTTDCPCDDCALIRDLARLARDIGTQEAS